MDVLCIFPTNLRLEPICYPGVVQAFNAFWHGAIEHNIEGIFVVVRFQHLSLVLARVPECPDLLEEVALAISFACSTTGVRESAGSVNKCRGTKNAVLA